MGNIEACCPDANNRKDGYYSNGETPGEEKGTHQQKYLNT